ncbi:MAG: glycosyl hydrolase family 8 [Colwellia sp.]
MYKFIKISHKLAFHTLLFSLFITLAHAQQPMNIKGSANTDKYRNLFAEAGHSTQAIEHKISTAFQQLFHGNDKNETLYYQAGSNAQGNLAYILDVNSKDVRSEGMSYGMMIAVQLNKQQEFDALWNWSKTYMYNSGKQHPAKGYFAWSVKPSGEKNDEMPAPDGEAYYVTALYFASQRWGNKTGIYHYKDEADKLLTDMRHRKIITGKTKQGIQTGTNLFHPKNAMTRFTPDIVNAEHTDPSYHLPAFYQVWAILGPKADRDFWQRAAKVSREYFHTTSHPKTGLTPDYSNFDGSPWAASWHPDSIHFLVDAWRTVMNWSVDWAWWSVDPEQQELSNRLLSFFHSQGIKHYARSYTLDGIPRSNGQPVGLIAMNATGALAATQPKAKEFVNALWQANIPSGKYRYYDGMLYMMALLHCSGEFKAWLPVQG